MNPHPRCLLRVLLRTRVEAKLSISVAIVRAKVSLEPSLADGPPSRAGNKKNAGMEETGRVVEGANSSLNELGASQHDHQQTRADLEIDIARAQEYALLATLLLRVPDDRLLEGLSSLQGDVTSLGAAHAALAQAAALASHETLVGDYFRLFIGVGRGEILPFASYYLTGFLQSRPLAVLREDLGRLGLQRADSHHDPEDHIGTLCEVMSHLVSDRERFSLADERRFFERHLSPWATRFFTDLESAKNARFYAALGTLGRVFGEIETEAFALN
jgi:TorA maturation chaperone TorD